MKKRCKTISILTAAILAMISPASQTIKANNELTVNKIVEFEECTNDIGASSYDILNERWITNKDY